MMIGTVPPSALHAAPVTYEAPVRAEERDHVRDLLGLREAAQRPALRDGLEHLLAGLAGPGRLLVGERSLS